jgi:hypothetical protein
MVLGMMAVGCADLAADNEETRPAAVVPARTALDPGSDVAQAAKHDERFVVAIEELASEGWVADWEQAALVKNPSNPDQYAVEVLLTRPSSEKTGWVGLAFGADSGVYVSIPEAADDEFGTTLSALTISQGGCSPKWCDYPYKLTTYWGCIVLDDNPLGYAQKRYSRYGYSTCNKTKYGTTSNPAWYSNMCGQTVACPGVQKSVSSYTKCLTSSTMQNKCK